MKGLVQAALLLSTLGGCAAQIGDACQANVECSPAGDRICDRSQFEGYCTVQGCSSASCPDDAVCVAFYPIGFLSVPCDPRTEDAVGGDVAPTDDCRSDETCLSSGLCVLLAQEQRFCMRRCESSGDCRDGYECAPTGVGGAEPVPNPDREDGGQARFCRQRGAR